MGAQWKHAGKMENSSKRGAMISKLVKEIMVAAKNGDPSPDHNSRLRVAVDAAKKNSVPRDTIERAIKKGAGLLDGELQIESVTFEGFAPHRVPIIVDCLTDNRNRTSADMRVLFRKGQLGTPGTVGYMFDRLGVVEATIALKPGQNAIDIEGVAIEAGAQNVEPLEPEVIPAGFTGARFFTEPQDLDGVSKAVTAVGWAISLLEVSYIAKNSADNSLSAEQKKEVAEFLNSVDEHDDVHRVYAGMK